MWYEMKTWDNHEGCPVYDAYTERNGGNLTDDNSISMEIVIDTKKSEFNAFVNLIKINRKEALIMFK